MTPPSPPGKRVVSHRAWGRIPRKNPTDGTGGGGAPEACLSYGWGQGGKQGSARNTCARGRGRGRASGYPGSRRRARLPASATGSMEYGSPRRPAPDRTGWIWVVFATLPADQAYQPTIVSGTEHSSRASALQASSIGLRSCVLQWKGWAPHEYQTGRRLRTQSIGTCLTISYPAYSDALSN